MTPLATILMTGCLAVGAGSDQILTGDLVGALPALSALPADTVVALAPAPGIRRVFLVPELRRLAARLHWPVEPDADLCVERPVHAPDPAEFLSAMQKALPLAKITIAEYSRQALPAGEIVFPAAALKPARAGSLWMGYVVYGGTHRFVTWARVKALVAVERVVAASDLRAGEAITAEQVRLEELEEPPVTTPLLQSLRDAIGKSPRVAIRAGSPLRADMLQHSTLR